MKVTKITYGGDERDLQLVIDTKSRRYLWDRLGKRYLLERCPMSIAHHKLRATKKILLTAISITTDAKDRKFLIKVYRQWR